ncbi:hypothetical protein G6F57_013657 [Rhizopus arrhizus]|uniref:Protein kinase domain-containing protein n=1 Tax=Rhizopus oryzae TaxID=64495 RepID=A0A9P6WY42_RHIOR|nr:hypothetical protein G6F23_011500 [Rhizopus arrhizus]KAG1396935.1 hypothetical protein G6F58_011616 [Rhizopus delemar]KAG0758900.1 hypothetical protein G6F24_009465 [Rhizopus arrhizus]KAG0778431.1 hypothetical protein G6F22_011238 [Rhizopus arrhizus]KAG0784049.1 hypothetical protein G6F21_010156 [Rhizopus arrhizus]
MTEDWKREFYKNGYPREVIVIEDSPTPSPLNYATTESTISSSPYNRKRYADHQQQPINTKRSKWNDTASNNELLAYHVLPNPAYTLPIPPPLLLQQQQMMPPVYDDKDGHYIIRINESLTPQYKIMRILGQGTFGRVVECYDRVRRKFCAIKIIRAIPKYRDASKIEIRVLNTLKKHDPLNLNKCIHLVEWFDYRNHVCMVFELLGQSVFDFLKASQFKPLPSYYIQLLAKQLLTSVAFLHELKLIHTDLKPENILLVNRDSHSDIRLIDFGSATFEQDYHSAIVSTRHYRAPEIIMGLGWSYPCDIWSIGCILVEFFTGEALFQTHDNIEHLAMMESVLGPIPTHMIHNASKEAKNWFINNKLKYPPSSTRQSRRLLVNGLKPLDQIVPPITTYNMHLNDLLKKILVYEPSARISAREALRHPFFHFPC